ncbi:hypothetical protein [Streptococcus catagoni]|uniref:hypothetical protein n=1 Tax=Streptococcus catagoni TaxID=2654874 RepID=UPI00140A94B7|nr:hypothetical protein [Streptococcus catagoni]
MGAVTLGLLAGGTSVSANTTTQGGITYPPGASPYPLGQDPNKVTYPLGTDPVPPGEHINKEDNGPKQDIPEIKEDDESLQGDHS